ncbi:glycosyltransferase family 2 protein [Campylobacter ureolyticus]|uniref:Glycosyltransferase, family 2 n=1 Tax=Campylobacter ureolyticus TaxID=827 RepID=A0AAE7EAR8_9BACT|nr:glycosyltransferase family 2 protein [Campylobacter ureolyticus]MCR8684996.1 glycosyltransferase family 2 protein [Campylobacter ureolyticus]QKF84725.1 glycosyltransferase, family 2 [Campylobacter ureolyticus]QQY35105.1 glycosyltransferase family 2 protein [Campylobacter ureolyticus]SUX21429.1 putative glycosyltransferase [Campylobacter ureolyticus]
MIKASVYIICQDEEKHIARVLESVKDFNEIIIVDSGSTDKTLEIAKRYNVAIFHKNFLGYSAQKEYAKNLCSNEWVLNLDADEELSDNLKDDIIETINENKCQALEIKIVDFRLKPWQIKAIKQISRVRFFKKEFGVYPEKLVHESIKINGKILQVKGFIKHYGTDSISKKLEKTNTYSTLRANEKFNKGKKSSFLKLTFIFPVMFFKSYFIRRNFLNGRIGFIDAINNAFYAFLKEAKLYELYLKEKSQI